MTRQQVFIWFFLFFSTTFLLADTLELSNGDTITGTIISMDEEQIIIDTEYGRLEVKREFIIKGVFTGDGTTATELENSGDNDAVVTVVTTGIPKDGLICEFLFDNSYVDSANTLYTIKSAGDVQFGKGIDGIEDHAISSDGTGRYLVLSGHNELDNLSSFTISFWINVELWGKTQYILSKWNATEGEKADGKFAVYTKQGFILCYLVDTTKSYHSLFTKKPMKLHVWNHIVITFDKGKTAIYINNSNAADKTFDFTSLKKDSSPLYILTAKASQGDVYSYYNLNGKLDNLRIYNRALSEGEVEALYWEKPGE